MKKGDDKIKDKSYEASKMREEVSTINSAQRPERQGSDVGINRMEVKSRMRRTRIVRGIR